jgi:hypothetical protein
MRKRKEREKERGSGQDRRNIDRSLKTATSINYFKRMMSWLEYFLRDTYSVKYNITQLWLGKVLNRF